MKKTDPKFVRAFDRAMLRSQFVSLFWGIIADRKKGGGFTLQALADALGKNKGEVSRWFSGDPNWTLNTVANLAHALDVEIRVEAVDRATGTIFDATGVTVQAHASGQKDILTSASPPEVPGPPIGASEPERIASRRR